MVSRIPLDTICDKKIETLSSHYDGKIEYIDISSIDNIEKIVLNTQIIDSKDAPSRAKQLVKNGDILVSTVRPNLNAVAVIERESDHVLVASTGYCVLRCNSEVNNHYVLHFCQSPYFIEDMSRQATGASYPAVSNSIVKSCLIPLRDLKEQSHIATVLDKITGLIALRKQQLAKLDELVKARFVEMFGDPVLNPRGWNKDALEVNVTLLNGRAYKQDELLDSGKYPVLRVGNFFSNRGWYYSDLELEDDKYCDNGDLLYAWSASFGAQIWNGGKVIYHYHIWKILVGNAYDKQFLCKLLDYATESLMEDTHGIAMMHLTKSGMEKTEFIVPPMGLQQQFAAFVEQTDKFKLTIQQGLDKLEMMKKALMQQYFGR